MSKGLLLHCDHELGARLFAAYGQPPLKFDRCLGVVDNVGELVGYVLFHNWNGSNIELSYYGENTMTPGIIRCIARFIICTFDPARLTVIISKRNRRFLRSVQKIGFKLEGAQRCFYGKKDVARNTGIRFVMFRDRIDQLARFNTIEMEKGQGTSC